MLQRTTKKLPVCAAVVLSVCLFSLPMSLGQKRSDDGLGRLFQRDSATIVITDSGLGGLSVCAELAREWVRLRVFHVVHVVFVNALPDTVRTYNSMGSRKEQLAVFDAALSGMNRWFHPDAILIACNTLSVIYPETIFAQNAAIPVVSIVDVGAKAIADRMNTAPSNLLLLFGTPTTIASQQYEERLGTLGIARERIVPQACRFLETEIQNDPQSDLVSNLIETYATEAIEKSDKRIKSKVFVGLCCSHYGYSTMVFNQVLQKLLPLGFELIDPNETMVRWLLGLNHKNRLSATRVNVDVVSKVEITEQEIQSIAAILEKTSALTANALRKYTHKGDLF